MFFIQTSLMISVAPYSLTCDYHASPKIMPGTNTLAYTDEMSVKIKKTV
jgi:hypothetical protein